MEAEGLRARVVLDFSETVLSMRRGPLIVMLAAAFSLLAAPTAEAMGFGRTATRTTLGQPLDFSATIVLDASETLARECVTAEVHAGDVRVPPGYVRVSLEPGGGGRNVRVTTSTAIDEPVITVQITVGCGSSLSRSFVAFVDPPLLNLAETQGATAPQQQRSTSTVAPLGDIVRAADADRRRSSGAGTATDRAIDGAADGAARREPRQLRTSRASRRAQRFAAADVATRSASLPSERTSSPTRSVARASGAAVATLTPHSAPRLRLEAPLPVVAKAPVAASAPPPAPPSVAPVLAASSGDAAAEALARERERIQQLEAGMTKLANDAKAMQQSVATLQARLREAESDRYANKLVYALAAAVVFFALLAVALWALRPRQRRRARWFDANAGQKARARSNPTPSAVPTAPPPKFEHEAPGTTSWTRGSHSVLPTTAPATIGGLEVTTVLGPEATRPLNGSAAAFASTATGMQAARRSGSLSMEELIDLEQQAEFFVVLGQDEAAIELLGAHIRDGEGVSPLPYLKLLEIHQRRGDRDAYERSRKAFRERFNAFAPEWSADLDFGRSLEDYPQTVARLQALWPTPMHAMQTLDGLLFRRNESDDAFDFQACRDLLFLYSIARELVGNVDTDMGSIDLFLPLEETTATLEGDSHLLDLDVSGDEFVIHRAPGRRGAGG